MNTHSNEKMLSLSIQIFSWQPSFVVNKIIVLSRWANREDWENWIATPTRKEFYKKIEKFLEYPEEIEVLSF